MKALGNCYEDAARFMLDNGWKMPNLALVHGIVINAKDNLPMGHAWLEYTVVNNKNGSIVICLDPLFNFERAIRKESYYQAGKIDEKNTVRFSFEETLNKINEYDHWGAWELQVPR